MVFVEIGFVHARRLWQAVEGDLIFLQPLGVGAGYSTTVSLISSSGIMRPSVVSTSSIRPGLQPPFELHVFGPHRQHTGFQTPNDHEIVVPSPG